MKKSVFFAVTLVAAVLGFNASNAFAAVTGATSPRPPQFVLISFDGSSNLKFWQETMDFTDRNNAKISYFISGVYLLKKQDAGAYHGPRHAVGHSDIGFGNNNDDDIAGRTQFIWEALDRGFDIGSHANGHFDGTSWTKPEWISEFTQFKNLVNGVFDRYPNLNVSFKSGWSERISTHMYGFRAPLLGENLSTRDVMHSFGFLYDSSRAMPQQWPNLNASGLWDVPLTIIHLFGTQRRTIAMDYNILYGQCNGHFSPKDAGACAVLSPQILDYNQEQTYRSYISAFLSSYYGNRAPFSVGHHFRLFNHGVYWLALQRFAAAVCGLPEVHCITHKQTIDWITAEAQRKGLSVQAEIASLNQGDFDKDGISTAPHDILTPQLQAPMPAKASPFSASIEGGASDEISDAAAKMMLKGDLPGAHAGEADENVDLSKYRYQAK